MIKSEKIKAAEKRIKELKLLIKSWSKEQFELAAYLIYHQLKKLSSVTISYPLLCLLRYKEYSI